MKETRDMVGTSKAPTPTTAQAEKQAWIRPVVKSYSVPEATAAGSQSGNDGAFTS
jgi:hypothetical protein